MSDELWWNQSLDEATPLLSQFPRARSLCEPGRVERFRERRKRMKREDLGAGGLGSIGSIRMAWACSTTTGSERGRPTGQMTRDDQNGSDGATFNAVRAGSCLTVVEYLISPSFLQVL